MESYSINLTLPGQQQAQPQAHTSSEVNAFIAQCQATVLMSQARLNEAQVFLNGAAELRLALNLPSVAEDGVIPSERQPLKPLFDGEDMGVLQERYMTIMKQYMEYADYQFKALLKKP